MRMVKEYTCPICGSSRIILEGKDDDDTETPESYWDYTCADCGYNLTWYSGDYCEEYGWMTEAKFHKIWDSGLYDSDNLVCINNKIIQNILNK